MALRSTYSGGYSDSKHANNLWNGDNDVTVESPDASDLDSLEYMRSPSPESYAETAGRKAWLSDSNSVSSGRKSQSSSPMPPRIHTWQECLEAVSFGSEGNMNNDAGLAFSQVPLSSSPPDLASSSPKSALSHNSDETDSSLASASSDFNSRQTDHFTVQSQLNPSLINVSEDSHSTGFAQKLHELLLSVLKERECQDETSAGTHNTMCYGTCVSYEDDSPSASSGGFGFDDVDSSKNTSEPDFTYSRGILRNSTEISPIFFGPEKEDSQLPEVDAEADTTTTYRVIKRAQSYLPQDCSSQDGQTANKRQKTGHENGAHTKHRLYAHRTASLRRAESLRSVPDDNRQTLKVTGCVPTVPATPVPATSFHGQNNPSKSAEATKVMMYPVPIIAPPLDHVAKLPLSAETLAKLRLSRFLEREAEFRRESGLSTRILERPPTRVVQKLAANGSSRLLIEDGCSWEEDILIEWEAMLGLGRERREEAIEWLLEVAPGKASGRIPSPVESSISSATGSSTSSRSSSSVTLSQSSSRSPSVSQISADTPTRRPSAKRLLSNLEDQLQNSPETRFHAAWMFLSYFYLTTASDSSSSPVSRSCSINSTTSSSTEEEGLELIVWDIAVACLALSVKFHRDFLDPLLPVYAHEYLSLAPHEISHEDLESAHRDVLSAFDFKLGVTPQPVMDELWMALPSLRSLLDFDDGWKKATLDSWTRLFIVLDEPDVQKFPVSMLTVTALMDGVIETMVDHYCRVEVAKTRSVVTAEERYLKIQTLRKIFNKQAREEAEGVFCDIQALTGITNAELRECRLWMNRRD